MKTLLTIALICLFYSVTLTLSAGTKYSDVELIAATLALEAADQGMEGQIAVANVFINRAEWKHLTIAQACLEGSSVVRRIGGAAAVERAKTDGRFSPIWHQVYTIAQAAVDGGLRNNVGPRVFFENVNAFGYPDHYVAETAIIIKDQHFWY